MFLSSWFLSIIATMEIVAKFFWQVVWQCVPRALKMSVLLPYLLEIGVEIFMNKMFYVCDLILNNCGGRIIGTLYRSNEIGHKLIVV